MVMQECDRQSDFSLCQQRRVFKDLICLCVVSNGEYVLPYLAIVGISWLVNLKT